MLLMYYIHAYTYQKLCMHSYLHDGSKVNCCILSTILSFHLVLTTIHQHAVLVLTKF